MTPVRSLIVSAIFTLAAVVAAIWLYPHLPARVPVHWDLHGRANGYAPRLWAAAMPALGVVALAVLTVALPVISPRRFEITPFERVYTILMLCTQGVLLLVGVCMLLVGAGHAVSMPRVSMLCVGVLVMIAGNYTGKLRKNFFVGIRTPWTLASDAVWERTHRLAGWLFMLGGMVAVIVTLLGVPTWAALIAVVAPGLVACVYSFCIYRVLE